MNIEKYDDELYSKFFVERVADSEFLFARLNEIQGYGGNVLVVGEPGVGKTIFLKRFLTNSHFARITEPNARTFIDLTTTPYTPETHQAFICQVKEQLAQTMAAHLKRLGDPCNDLPDDKITPTGQEMRYNYCALKLSQLSTESTKRNALIHYVFLDDVDYLSEPGRCFVELLECLKPLFFSRHFCVIVACRTPAFNRIKSHRDYNVSRAFDDAKLLRLEPLAVHSILKARIQTLTQAGHTLRSILNSQLSRTSLKTLFEFIASVISGLDPTDDIELFEYPFTERQHAFMREMTNGNVRHVLLMAQEYLHYMCANRELIKKEEQGFLVGRPAVIKHFTQETIDAHIRIENLHAKKTFQYSSEEYIKKHGIPARKIGNSIYIALLETYKFFRYPNHFDSQYIQKLWDEYGLTKQDIKEGTCYLIDIGLIRERELTTRPALGAKPPFQDYDLTEKGQCYLDYLIHWDEYIHQFGVSRHHKEFRTTEIKNAIAAALLEFLINILVVKRQLLERKSVDVLKMPKGPFRSQFCKLYRDLFRHLDATDKLTIHEPSEDEITNYLSVWHQVVKGAGSSDVKNYEIDPQKIIEQAEKNGLPLSIKSVYDLPAFQKFVKTFSK
ncbi:MAG: ATP-binding protein [Verrucomicrobiota bacterium]